jgi:hypothetical protein
MQTLLRHKRLLIGLSVSLSVLVPFLLYSFYLGRSNTAHIASLCAEQICACDDWYRHSVGQYQIENNVWNKENANKYQQCVFIKDGDEGIDAGWAWNWPGIRFNVVAYPSIIYGKNPWLSSTSPMLPIRIGDINCLKADFKVIQQGSSKGNLSFDLWVTSSASAQPEDISREIMIWLSHKGFQPAGSRQDSINLDGKDIGLWKKENHNASNEYEWTFFAFVYRSDLTEGSINLNGLLSYLVDNGHISPDEYLSGVQLGNEIVSGYGQSLIQNYKIRFCD